MCQEFPTTGKSHGQSNPIAHHPTQFNSTDGEGAASYMAWKRQVKVFFTPPPRTVHGSHWTNTSYCCKSEVCQGTCQARKRAVGYWHVQLPLWFTSACLTALLGPKWISLPLSPPLQFSSADLQAICIGGRVTIWNRVPLPLTIHTGGNFGRCCHLNPSMLS